MAYLILEILIAVITLGILGRKLPIPLPVLWVLGGLIISFIPGLPAIHLMPELIFLIFLPPLLYADAWLIPKRELFTFKRPIILLSLGLVITTTTVVGLVAHYFIPSLSLPLSFALGAILSPTDVIAVSAIVERLKVPKRIDIILKGESLINDASGLVAFKFAIIAAGTGYFSYANALQDFIILSLGGIMVGLAVAWSIEQIFLRLARHNFTDCFIEVAVSILIPFAAYLPAEHFHLSGVLAVVTAGLYTGWKDLAVLSSESRMYAKTIWGMLLFLLSGTVFVLLGLQLPNMLEGLTTHSFFQLLWYVGLIFSVLILTRMIWVFPGAYLPRLLFRKIRDEEPSIKISQVFIIGWAGIRGTITLAAALSIPILNIGDNASVNRDLVIFIAFGVTIASLMIQGTSLPYIIRKLKVMRENNGDSEKKIRISIAQATINNLEVLKKKEKTNLVERLINEYKMIIDHLSINNEKVNAKNTNLNKDHKLRKHALEVEKRELYRLYKDKIISEDLFREIRFELDLRHQRIS